MPRWVSAMPGLRHPYGRLVVLQKRRLLRKLLAGKKGEAMNLSRRSVKPTLVYWHCGCWWQLELGSSCPMEHDGHRETARKRRAWICYANPAEGGIAYLSRQRFLDHNEEDCYADV